MADVGYLALMVAFALLATLFVIGCDRIIGPDEAAVSDAARDDDAASAPSPQPNRTRTRR